MPGFRVEQFKATTPRVFPHLLPDNGAQVAMNCKLIRGHLAPWKSAAPVLATQAGIKTIVRYDTTKFLCWTKDVSVARSVVPGDTDQRVFWTTNDGSAPPRFSTKTKLAMAGSFVVDPANFYPLGLPYPDPPPAVALGGTAPAQAGVSKSFVYAWVRRGVLGHASATLTVTVPDGYSVAITGLSVNPPTSFPKPNGGTVTYTGSTDEDWYAWCSKFTKRVYMIDPTDSTKYLLLKDDLPWDKPGYENKGESTGLHFRAVNFHASASTAPAAGATIEAMAPSEEPRVTRTYAYGWVWQDASGKTYRSELSADATISATQTDRVWVRGQVSTPTSGIPSWAVNVKRVLWRKVSTSDYRRCATGPRDQTELLDAKGKGPLGVKHTAYSQSGTIGVVAAATDLQIDDGKETTQVETAYYRWTYVSELGEESAPSLPSAKMERLPYQTVTVITGGQPAGYTNITKKRLYRTDGQGVFRLLADNLPITDAQFVDNVLDEDLGVPLATEDYDPPPSGLKCICAIPGGGLVGISGNEVCFSEPGHPYAWPIKYRLTMDYPGVGLAVTANGILVGTQGVPYLVQGSDPASMVMQRIEEMQSCAAATSVVDMGDYVIYASPDGLVAAAGPDVKVISDAVMTRDQWQALNPASIRAYLYEGRYFGFYDTGSAQGGFMFDPADPGFVNFDFYATAGCNDLIKDALYLQVGGSICQWDTGLPPLTYTWRSRYVVSITEMCPAAAQVDALAYPVTFRLYADGALKHTQTVTDNRPFRLPSGYLAKAFEVELSGTSEVRRVAIATSMPELIAL
jgi:hypothetical protein